MMGKIYMIVAAIVFSALTLSGHSITEDNYIRLDNEIWERYDEARKRLGAELSAYPQRKDSLMKEAEELGKRADEENMRLAVRFASTPSGFRRLFMVRLDFRKDSLERVLESVPARMRESPYGRSLRMHLDNDQVEEGSQYYDFAGKDSEGNYFRLSSLAGKRVLLLYGGLGCMGPHGRKELAELYADTQRENFEIVVYEDVKDVSGLKKIKDSYGIDCVLVSDFLGDHTPFKIIYGAQARPTCFLVDASGVVRMKTVGFSAHRVRKLMGLAPARSTGKPVENTER